jgi:hypothetical protein
MRMNALSELSTVALAVPLVLTIGVCSAAAACNSGFVWRDAADGDAVCVTPEDRETAKKQNANAANNREPGGGPYGPNTCRQGYVWREAYGGDVVCVTPYERDQAKQQNALSPQRTAN